MAKIKYEFLAQYHDQHGLPVRNRLFGHIDSLSDIGSKMVPFSNWLMNSSVSKWMMDKFFGIDRRRSLPNFAEETFVQWFKTRPSRTLDNRQQVVFFYDTFTNYNYPNVGQSVVKVLESAGFDVILPPKRCCGRPMISKGMLNEAIQNARHNISWLLPYAQQGLPIVGCEPSCISALTDDYVELLPGDDSRLVAEHTLMIEEFLLKEKDRLRFSDIDQNILLHGHCHQKALIGLQPSLEVLNLPVNYTVNSVDSSCCGMAGSFGYEKEHYDLSMKIAEARLLEPIRSHLSDSLGNSQVAISGTSCREQIKHSTGYEPKHIVELLCEAIIHT